MKKLLPLLFCFLLLSLTGCSIGRAVNDIVDSVIDGPERVTVEGVTYRRGFYGERGELNPVFGQVGDIGSETLQKEIIYDDGNYQYRRVDFAGHDWVHSSGGGTTGGVVYCAEDQWEETRDYYADPDNFEYYYHLDANPDETQADVSIPEIDPRKFDELFAFGRENSYNPFGSNEKIMQKTRRLPAAAYDAGRGALWFYKVSKDGYFTAGGHKYFVHDGKLLKLFFYDGGRDNGGIQEVVVIDVPDELGQYFIDLCYTA